MQQVETIIEEVTGHAFLFIGIISRDDCAYIQMPDEIFVEYPTSQKVWKNVTPEEKSHEIRINECIIHCRSEQQQLRIGLIDATIKFLIDGIHIDCHEMSVERFA